MSLHGPYRPAWSPSFEEEELWQRLDEGLLVAMDDPVLAWSIVWWVVNDAADFPDVRRAAAAVLWILEPCDRSP